MSGDTKTVPSLKSFDHVLGHWLRKWLPFSTKPIHRLDADYDKSDYYQLDLSDLEPLEASLTLPDGIAYHTVILKLSASELSCKLPRHLAVPGNLPVCILYALPLEEPVLMEMKAILTGQTVNGSPDTRVGKFRFHNMDEEDRELIHRFVMKKQFELIQRNRRLETSPVE